MALTPDLIKANEGLKDLPDAQVAAIVALSTNDETAVINKKVGELHGGYDKDIFEISGVEKNQGEKSYDYAKRVLGDFKTKAESTSTLTEEITTHKATISNLQKQIKDGNTDEALKQQLKDANDKVTSLQGQLKTDKEAWDKEKEGFTSKLTAVKVGGEFEKATAGLKFKGEYPEAVQKTLLAAARESILGKYTPDWIENTKGNNVMVLRDDKGEIVRNPANQQEPFTAEELLRENLKDVLDAGKKTSGGGTNPNKDRNPKVVDIAELGSAKTQDEASDIIVKHLMSKGVARGTAAFAEQQKELWESNKIGDLPIR